MKYVFVIKFIAVIAITGFFASCLSTAQPRDKTPAPSYYGLDKTASGGESEIVLNSTAETGVLRVFLNGTLIQTMLPQDSLKLIVPDGKHTLMVTWTIKDGMGRDVLLDGEPLSLDIVAMRHIYSITLPSLLGGSTSMLIGRKVRLTQVSANEFDRRTATSASRGIEGAVIRASERLIPDLPRGAAVAVIGISANDNETSESAVDELEYQLVKASLFRLVDRKQLDLIRSEQAMHMSWEISDESAVSIGKMVGASIAITGSVSGSGSSQGLTLRVLNVETGIIITMEREGF